ncbi:MAG: ABC transporter ATP-binding protein/permease [Lachnospiraceae bacterium]|nr:ABC transporter ATP-binding protein/permease [Lachnospiraceae bacterium]
MYLNKERRNRIMAEKQKKYEKPKNRRGTILRLGSYLMQYKYWVLLALALTVGSNLLALMGPMLSGYAIDAIELGVGNVDFARVFYYAGLMVVFYLASSVLSYLIAVLMIHISRKVVYKMRQDVFTRLLELPVGYFDTHQTGDIISRISYDIDTVNTSLANDLVQILTTLITVIGAFAMMIVISPRLVLIFAFTVPLSAVLTKLITQKTRPLFRLRSRKLGELNGFVEEMISGQKTLKAYHQEENTIKKFDGQNEEAVEAYYRAEYYGSVVGPTVNFINNLSLTLVSVFGALLYLAGQMRIGSISSFILYSRKFSGPINEAANIMSELQSALAAAERVFNMIDEPTETLDREGAVELKTVKGDVSLEKVSFGYTKDQVIIKDLSLHAASGKLVAIVGPTGAGKTTLINLLMRFYDVESGHIYVDNHEIRDVTRCSLRKAYAMVLQDTWLFQGTVFENIAYGKQGATIEEVTAAAKAAKIHPYIMRLPQGYDTVLTDEGTNISKGQKQLLTIARAMLLDAPMLILDEATSNVDTRTEQQIQQAMRKLMEHKTCFVIAHRLSTIQNADVILVVNHGEIVEQGTHGELMEKKGFYHQLYRAQFE